MTIEVEFEDNQGNYYEHVNYNIKATQNGKVRPRALAPLARTAASYLGLGRRARLQATNDNSKPPRPMFRRASAWLALVAVASATLLYLL